MSAGVLDNAGVIASLGVSTNVMDNGVNPYVGVNAVNATNTDALLNAGESTGESAVNGHLSSKEAIYAKNPKMVLNELVTQRAITLPVYVLESSHGPSNNPYPFPSFLICSRLLYYSFSPSLSLP